MNDIWKVDTRQTTTTLFYGEVYNVIQVGEEVTDTKKLQDDKLVGEEFSQFEPLTGTISLLLKVFYQSQFIAVHQKILKGLIARCYSHALELALNINSSL